MKRTALMFGLGCYLAVILGLGLLIVSQARGQAVSGTTVLRREHGFVLTPCTAVGACAAAEIDSSQFDKTMFDIDELTNTMDIIIECQVEAGGRWATLRDQAGTAFGTAGNITTDLRVLTHDRCHRMRINVAACAATSCTYRVDWRATITPN